MGPGAPGFARVSSMNNTGKLALAHATRREHAARAFNIQV